MMMMSLADWLYQFRFWYDQLYLVPLSFAILTLAWATTAYIVTLVIGMRKADRNTDKIVKALDRIALSTAEVKEELKRNHEMLEKNNEMLGDNQKNLDGLTKIFKQWDWSKYLNLSWFR